jgi:hypothetical protein
LFFAAPERTVDPSTLGIRVSPAQGPKERSKEKEMTRTQRTHSTSLTLDELLGQSAWFTALDEPARAQVRNDASERAVALGDSLSHHGERQHAWYGVLEGLIKWAITAH